MTLIDEKQQEVETRPPTRSIAPQVIVGAALVLIGALWFLERLGAIDLTATTVLAGATIAVGVAVMVLATDGPHIGLIIFGLVLALAGTASALAPLEGFQGGVGERVVEPTSVQDIEADYNLAMGTLTIDLRDLDVSSPISLSASVGMGELVVRVPEGVQFEVDARAGAGQTEILGQTEDGLGVEDTYTTDSFEEGQAGLSLDLDVFMGRVEVTSG
ncbi:MAG: LiaF-related protein [Acidimicrobiia bacterium]